MQVLITTPDLALTGGVSNYFGVLRPYLQGVAEYLTIGSRVGESSRVGMILRLISDYTRFTLKLLRRRYDLVHINTAFGRRAFARDMVFVWVAKILRRKVLVFVRGGDPGCLESAWKDWFRIAYGRADAFVVLARSHVGSLRELGYGGTIDCETTVVSRQALEAARVRVQRSEKRFRILFLARLEKVKGLYEAVEAYRIVKRRHASAELVIAGDGAEKENVRRYVRERAIPDVQLLGHLVGNSKTDAFMSSDLYLFASYYEGMPNSVLEAMAHGLPVVTRRVGGIPDFFEEGQMGFSAESAEPHVLAELMERLIEDPELACRIGANNRAYAKRNFAAPVVARRLVGIYSSVIGWAVSCHFASQFER